MEELYSGLINLVPIGLFKVAINPKGEHIIEHCNDAFARNLNFQSNQELIGKDIRQFQDDFDEYYSKMVENDEKGLKNDPFILSAPTNNSLRRKYQVYPRIERDSAGNIIGRVGAQRDVTQENELRRRLEEIQSDVGQVLHAYSTTLVMARTNFEAVLLALTSNKTHFEKETFQEATIFGEIDQSIRSIRSLVIRLKQELGAAAPDAAQAPVLTEILRLTELLREVSGLDAVNQYTATNSETAVRMIDLLSYPELVRQQPKERLRALRQALDELIRSTFIIFLHRGLEGVLEMDAPVNSLRSYLIDGIKVQEEKTRVDIYELLLDVSKNLFSYAAYRGTEIKYHSINPIMRYKVLWIEDNAEADLFHLLAPVHVDGRFNVDIAVNATEAFNCLCNEVYHVVIVDSRIPHGYEPFWKSREDDVRRDAPKAIVRLGLEVLGAVLGIFPRPLQPSVKPENIEPGKFCVFSIDPKRELEDVTNGLMSQVRYERKTTAMPRNILVNIIRNVLNLS